MKKSYTLLSQQQGLQEENDSDHNIPTQALERGTHSWSSSSWDSGERVGGNSRQQTVGLKDKQRMDYIFTDHISQQKIAYIMAGGNYVMEPWQHPNLRGNIERFTCLTSNKYIYKITSDLKQSVRL